MQSGAHVLVVCWWHGNTAERRRQVHFLGAPRAHTHKHKNRTAKIMSALSEYSARAHTFKMLLLGDRARVVRSRVCLCVHLEKDVAAASHSEA